MTMQPPGSTVQIRESGIGNRESGKPGDHSGIQNKGNRMQRKPLISQINFQGGPGGTKWSDPFESHLSNDLTLWNLPGFRFQVRIHGVVGSDGSTPI